MFEVYLKNLQKALNLIDMPEIEDAGEAKEEEAKHGSHVKQSFNNLERLAGVDLGLEAEDVAKDDIESEDDETPENSLIAPTSAEQSKSSIHAQSIPATQVEEEKKELSLQEQFEQELKQYPPRE